MESQIKLRQVASGWEFESERHLENFVWSNLEKLFGYKPLKRQHQVNGQYCDIIAVGKSQELVVLELKNSEDRYIVQQLTRYYDALLQEKHFYQQINFQIPVTLIAVAPKFHRDNYIDRKYHQLKFQFLSFHVICKNERFSLNLIDVDTNENFHLNFDYSFKTLSDKNIPIPPKRFYQLLERCTNEQKSKLAKFREKVLIFDYRMEEVVHDGGILYGKGRNKYCAELRLNSKKELVCFLWLPHKFYTGEQVNIIRFRIWTDWQRAAIVRPAARGLGKITSIDIELAKQAATNHSLNKFIDEALQRWFERI
ncbi:endonuclease NucS domain-containing protein [Nostoc sp.]|uniref:endonuclease NucS domain-containing protein n=1 Tax=Nostoc sp. TaxID=1180 RepID=UPI002FFAD0A1